MADNRALYEKVILDHNRSPRNFGRMEHPDREAEGYNALCGDQLHVYLKMDGDRIADVKFEGAGCAISKSSASVMTTEILGKTRDEVQALFDRFKAMIILGARDADRDRRGWARRRYSAACASFRCG
jgi:nitrogen fixation protein NifU and related proteins